jgi:hypothetical protein
VLATLVGLSLVVSGAGCAGDEESMTYSVDEVLRAFEAAAYPLVEQPPPAGSAAAAEGTYLSPTGGAPLIVVVATDQAADDAWPDYVRLGGDEDSLTIRRANVVAISDGGLASRVKARVRDAMHALPDRGYPVDVLEDR